tara:strand:+ start:4655 stop:5092 length:438 start_codon:yes stop_codon:yes gene_type:complete
VETPSRRVREATYRDIPHLLGLGYKFHQYSPYRDLPYDINSVSDFIKVLIDSPTGVLYTNGEGVIGGLMHPLYFGGGNIAQELFWFAEGGGMELLSAFEGWAISQNASGVSVSSLVVGEREDRIIDKLYSRKGYKAHEKAYFKEL